MFGHDTMPFPRRDIVRVPLAECRISSGDVLQTTSDGREGYVALEGGASGVLFLPSQISEKGLRWCANLHSLFGRYRYLMFEIAPYRYSRSIVRTAIPSRSCR